MKEIIIREMKDSDWEEVKSIYQQGIDSGISTFMRRVPEFEYWDNSKLKIGRLVAIYDGKIVGWIVLSPTSAREEYSGVCEISVYIHQDYKRMGIGRKLILLNLKYNSTSSLHKKCILPLSIFISCNFLPISNHSKTTTFM